MYTFPLPLISFRVPGIFQKPFGGRRSAVRRRICLVWFSGFLRGDTSLINPVSGFLA